MLIPAIIMRSAFARASPQRQDRVFPRPTYEKHRENYQNTRSITTRTTDVIADRDVLAIATSSLGIAFHSRTRHTLFYNSSPESICLISRQEGSGERGVERGVV